MNTDLLRRLCETPGVPGREERVRALIQDEIKGLFDEETTDAMGSLICRRHPRDAKGKALPAEDAPVVMLLCHMDEIGFYVSSIDENGFLWVNAAGGFDTRNLFSRRVLVCTDKGDYPAVMNPGGKPVHIASAEDRKKVPEVSEFFIDTGMTKEAVDKTFQIGDTIVMDEPFREMGDKFVSKALDNRVACWLGIESIRQLDQAGTGHGCEIVVAFTVQEEVGLRGAKTSSFAVRPDIGIGLDVTLACDTPGVPKQESVTTQGEGFALHIKDGSFISDHALTEQIQSIAKKNKIKLQRSILGRGGQDGAAAQQAAAGARAVGITVGTRYIHTVTEMIDKNDLEAARDILAAYLAEAR
ncbi:MAG TPA: M42 family peptidase [Phycisphaerales bacterium]|nr:M42 family peptidase [Phycisphaerales bacterium]